MGTSYHRIIGEKALSRNQSAMPSPEEQLIHALDDKKPAESVHHLAVTLRDYGMPQAEMLKLYTKRMLFHREDEDETRYNALLDTLDYITGWCRQDCALYPKEGTSDH